MKKSFFILILLSFIIQLSSQDKVDLPSFRRSETYPDYKLVEKVPIEERSNKAGKYRIDHGDGQIRTLYDESNNQILSLKQDIYKFDEYADFAVSENGITVFNGYEKLYTPEFKTMIKWLDKKGNVINTYDLKMNQAIRANYIANKNSWLIFTELADYEVIPDPTISYGGVLVFDEYGNKTLELDIPLEYDNFDGYSTNKTGELIVATFLKTKYSNNEFRYPHSVLFNIYDGYLQKLQISYRGIFSENNELYHNMRTLVDVTSGEVIFKSGSAYHAFPASKESGIIALIEYTYFKIIDYRKKKLLFMEFDKQKAKIYSVSPDASEIIIHHKGYAYIYQRKKVIDNNGG